MADDDNPTVLEALEEYFGGSTLPNLSGPGAGSSVINQLFEAFKIVNGVTDEKLDNDEMRKSFSDSEMDDLIEGAQGPSLAMATILYYFMSRASEPDK